MILLYLLACVPALIGGYLWITDKEIVWWEWIIGCVAAFLFAFIFHFTVLYSMTADTETWSGHVTKVTFYPKWTAEWDTEETTTDSDGKEHTETVHHSETHQEYWTLDSSITEDQKISESNFNMIKRNFGNNYHAIRPYKPDFSYGDRNVYITDNATGYIQPMTDKRTFENKIKAVPTLFAFEKVSKDVPVFNYPKNGDILRSDRLIGNRGEIDLLEWDRLNARLGSYKKVNLILIGFNNQEAVMGRFQEAKWLGGKKNDLVLCYGTGAQKWSYVFGWTERDIVKRNLETLLLEAKIDNTIIPKIEEEVNKNYVIKDWHKFDYIKISIPLWSYFVYLFLLAVTQVGLYFAFRNNDEDKEDEYGSDRGYRSYNSYKRGRF